MWKKVINLFNRMLLNTNYNYMCCYFNNIYIIYIVYVTTINNAFIRETRVKNKIGILKLTRIIINYYVLSPIKLNLM